MNQKIKSIFKNFGMLLFVSLFFMMSANALTIQQGQTANLYDYNSALKGNLVSEVYTSGVNEQFNVENISRFYDVQMNFDSVSQPFYIVIDNLVAGTTYEITYSNNLNVGNIVNTFNTTLEEEGKYYYKFTPSNVGEEAVIYIENTYNVSGQPPQVFFLGYQEEKPQGFSYVIGSFVNFFVDVLEINLSLWQILFYLVVFIISTTLVFFLFGVAFLVFDYTQKFKKNARPHREFMKEED